VIQSRTGVVKLFHRVHAAIGFGEQVFYVVAIVGAKCGSNAKANQIAAADQPAGVDCQFMQTAGLFTGCFRVEAGSDDDEFIATHAGNLVVTTADFLEVTGKFLQKVVTFEMAVKVVNLFEVVEVADHDGEGRAGAAAAGEFA
jgi:hypothetical protein